MGAAALSPRRHRARARKNPARVGQAGVGARRRRPHGGDRDPAGGRGPREAVRRAPHARPALRLRLDSGHARRAGQRARPHRRRGARRRRELPGRPRPDRRAEGAPDPHGARRARAGDHPRLPRQLRRVLVPRTRAAYGLRPRVRAGAADRHRARSRPDALASGRSGRLVRVHGDALRPHSAWGLQGRADDERTVDLGGASKRDRRRSRALARRIGRAARLGARRRERRGRRARRRNRAALALPRTDRGRALVDALALHELQGGRFGRGRAEVMVPLRRRDPTRRRDRPLRTRRARRLSTSP